MRTAISKPGPATSRAAVAARAGSASRAPTTTQSGAGRWGSPRCACGGGCPRCSAAARPQAADLERDAGRFARANTSALASVATPVGSGTAGPLVLSQAAVAALRASSGLDFSGVRIHAGGASESACAALGAHAFTLGRDIHFGDAARSAAPATRIAVLAHELGHVDQQRRLGPRLQRWPLGAPLPFPSNPPAPVPTPAAPGGTPPVAAPAPAAAPPPAGGATFGPTAFRPHNPIDRIVARQPAGLTSLVVNGKPTPPADLETLITPTKFSHSPGAVTGQDACRFDPSFAIATTAVVDELEAPTATGWHAKARDSQVGVTGCAGDPQVSVTLRGKPDDASYQRLVHTSEMEHVAELKTLHERHLVPYHAFVLGLSATAGSATDCEQLLLRRLGQRPDQAAIGFTLGDIAATRRFDDPASTHHGKIDPPARPVCGQSVTLTASHDHPPVAGADPGNVVVVAPTRTAVDASALSVNGTDLLSAGAKVRGFTSHDNAVQALGVLASLGVTEILSFGPLDILMSGSSAATGTLHNIGTHAIDPKLYQVAADVSTASDWAISQVTGRSVYTIANFHTNRDTAYSAYDRMQALGIRVRHWIGSDSNPDWIFQTG